MRGKTAVPLLVAAADKHALAVEVHLKPLLAELGAQVPGRGLFVDESELAADQTVLITSLRERLGEAGWFLSPVGAGR
ncbi:hypothetical protein GCM10010492_44170 [Saccharothrix mutabilis subsp. mutabilis]|uniref:Uncharacterized protein n=1 Tax=Saccharothrix mutabilis subsp. mutabilis TaxID=66855 RepID=A0ABN0U6H4_9PSEU